MYSLYRIGIRVYYFLIWLLVPFNKRAAEWVRGRSNQKKNILEKIPEGNPVIWFHASSLGEYEQTLPLIKKWKIEKPNHFIILTFYSPSGFNQLKDNKDIDRLMYLPRDITSEVCQFLDYIHPNRVIFVKNEIWPVLLKELVSRKIPVFLVSSVFRRKQLFFKWYGAWYLSVLKLFSYIYVQDSPSGKLLESYGILDVKVSGDTRIDRVLDLADGNSTIEGINHFTGESKIIVAGSSWQMEEKFLKRFFSENKLPGVKLILAPHDVSPKHLKAIKEQFGEALISYEQLLSEPASAGDKSVLLIDRIGLLSRLYRYGHIAVIGGAFGAGLHNVLEPAVFGLPIIFGPRFHKFIEAVELVSSKAGFSVKSYADFHHILALFIEDKNTLSNAGKGCSRYINSNKGATDLVISHLLENA